VHREWRKSRGWALHYRVRTLHQIEHIHRSRGVVLDRTGEPVAPHLNAFEFVQSGAFLAPVCSRIDGCDRNQELSRYPLGVAVPLDVTSACSRVYATVVPPKESKSRGIVWLLR
jgi:hypothetical protein